MLNSEGCKKFQKVILLSFLLIISIGLSFQENRSFQADELEGIQTAWKITQGEEIYQDFFQHHHPFSYYLPIPVIRVWGENITALLICRALFVMIGAGTCFYTYRLALLFYKDKLVALASIVVLLGFRVFMSYGFQIRPDTPMLLFELISTYYFFDFLNTLQKKKLLISAIALGIAFLFLQKAIVLVAYLLCLMLWNIRMKRIGLNSSLLFIGAFFITIFPFYTYVFFSGKFDLYITLNWIVNAKALPPPDKLFYHIHIIFLLFSIFPLLFFIRGTVSGKSILWQSQLVCLTIGLLLILPLFPFPSVYYILPALPYMAVVGAYDVVSTSKKSLQPLRLLCALLSMLLMATFLTNNILVTINPLTKQLEKINYILSITQKEDTTLGGQFVRARVFRKDIDYFWFNVSPSYGLVNVYRDLTGYRYDPYELLEKYQPKIINIDAFETIEDPRILDHYTPTEVINVWVRVK